MSSSVDCSDILRYALVSIIGSVDRYIHLIVELGMIECQLGIRAQTKSYRAFRVAMGSVHGALSAPPVPDWFASQVREQHSLKTFQKSNAIQGAIKLIKDIDIWARVASRLKVKEQDLRIDYDLYVDRRNSIVHEADMTPLVPGQVTPLSEETVLTAISLIEQIIEAIHLEVA